MVCVPCIVIPILLWVFHRFLQPYLMPLMPAKIQNWFSVKAEKMEQFGGPPVEEKSSENLSEKKPCDNSTPNGATTEIKEASDKKMD